MATLREVKKRIRTVKSTSEISITALALFLFVTSSSFGFDGNRKGFVLGGGLGFSPYSKWSADGTFGSAQVVEHLDESGAGPGLNFIIGHAWDERNMIVFEINGAVWKSEQLAKDPTVWQGIHGTVWYHYYGSGGRSFFTAAGLVLYRFVQWTSSTLAQNIGPALILGAGYEFSPHWQIGGYLGTGYDLRGSSDWYFTHFNLLVNYVAF